MNTPTTYILLAYIIVALAGYWLEYLKLSYLKKYGTVVPPEFSGSIDQKILASSSSYTIESTTFGIFSSVFNNILLILFFFAGILNVYTAWIASLNLNVIVSGIVFFMLLVYADTFLTIPFSIYKTFKIERKFGFNTMTVKLWITDFIKSILISTILLSFIISAGLWLIEKSPVHWWLWVWLFFLIFSIFMMYISPYVIEPLFNKFHPVEDENLKTGIQELTKKVGVRISKVLKMDASKRTKHTNAYFTGIGRVKRVVLFDTLLNSMDTAEILVVLGHELGHWKKKHVLKQLVLMEVISLGVLYVSFRLMQGNLLLDMFGIATNSLFAKIVILAFLGTIVSFPFTPAFNLFSRRHEREADTFACELTGNPGSMISALVKLSKDNLSNLHPHPVYSAFYYSHPPVTERIKHIRMWSKRVESSGV
jgi:STE24 endopeptidase